MQLESQLKRAFAKVCPNGMSSGDFDRFDERTRKLVQRDSGAEPDEEIAVVSYLTDQNWIAVSSKRVFWRSNDKVSSLNGAEIHSATVDMMVNRNHGVNWDKGFSILTIRSVEGRQFDIEVEPGEALYGLVTCVMDLRNALR